MEAEKGRARAENKSKAKMSSNEGECTCDVRRGDSPLESRTTLYVAAIVAIPRRRISFFIWSEVKEIKLTCCV